MGQRDGPRTQGQDREGRAQSRVKAWELVSLSLLRTSNLGSCKNLGANTMFERFYSVYPRKVARLDAEKAWNQMIRRYDAETIIKGAETFARAMADEGKEPQYIPYPASWLRAGRWMDQEQETIKPQPIFRPATSVEEVKAFYASVGKPVSPEIAKAKSVNDLPAFARMIPVSFNVVRLRREA